MASKNARRIVSEVAADVAAETLAKRSADPTPGRNDEQLTTKTDGENLEARSVSRSIRTVEDLLRHIEADMTRYEVASSEATKWECGAVNRQTGRIEVTELFRVFVKLKPRPGPGVAEVVAAMIEAAKGDIRKPIVPKPKRARSSDLWAVMNIADPHFGKYAWRMTAGADYDLGIASRFLREAATELLGIAESYRPGRLTISFLGDLFHYDTPGGTTTGGTPLERDGRLPKMFNEGSGTMLAVVDAAGRIAATDTVLVPGNHDETLSTAFRRVMLERFRNDRRVFVENGYTPRKYLSHKGNLLGFTHGDKAKKKLPQIMAMEAAAEWSRCPYREFHTGHLHNQSAENARPIATIESVVVRTSPALCPQDDWHSAEGFIGSRQAMELFVYQPGGGLKAMHVSGPAFEARRK